MGCSLFTAAKNSIYEFKLVFQSSPREIVPPGLIAQVDSFRRLVPKGSFVIYLMDRPDAWEFGLWKRALFPDYTILPVADPKVLDSAWARTFRSRHQVRYVILAGSSLPSIVEKAALPEYPKATTTTLAVFRD